MTEVFFVENTKSGWLGSNDVSPQTLRFLGARKTSTPATPVSKVWFQQGNSISKLRCRRSIQRESVSRDHKRLLIVSEFEGIVRGPAVRGFHARIFADFIYCYPRQSAQHSSAANSSSRCRHPVAWIVIAQFSPLKFFRRLKSYVFFLLLFRLLRLREIMTQ